MAKILHVRLNEGRRLIVAGGTHNMNSTIDQAFTNLEWEPICRALMGATDGTDIEIEVTVLNY